MRGGTTGRSIKTVAPWGMGRAKGAAEGKLQLPRDLARTRRVRAKGRARARTGVEGHGVLSDFLIGRGLQREGRGDAGPRALRLPEAGSSARMTRGRVRAEAGGVRAPRDVDDASPSSSAECEVSRLRRRLAVERRVSSGRWSPAARSESRGGRGGHGTAVAAAAAGGGGRGRAGGCGSSGGPRASPVKRPRRRRCGRRGEGGQPASRGGVAPPAPRPCELSVPSSRSCSGSSILASAVAAAGRMCRLLSGRRRRR